MARWQDWRGYYARFFLKFGRRFVHGKLEAMIALAVALTSASVLWWMAAPLEDLRDVLPQLFAIVGVLGLLAMFHLIEAPVILDAERRQVIDDLREKLDRGARASLYASMTLTDWRADLHLNGVRHCLKVVNGAPVDAHDVEVDRIVLGRDASGNELSLQFDPVAFVAGKGTAEMLATVMSAGRPISAGRNNIARALSAVLVDSMTPQFSLHWLNPDRQREYRLHRFALDKGVVRVTPVPSDIATIHDPEPGRG